MPLQTAAGDRGPAAEPGWVEKWFLGASAAEQKAAAAMCLAEAHVALPGRRAEPFPCAMRS